MIKCKICEKTAMSGTLNILGSSREPYHAACLYEVYLDLKAERDALRERCGKLDVALHIAAQDLAFVASHSTNIQLATMARKASNDAYAARSAALAATEVPHV